jgi:prevent-host-death family protein
MIKLNFKLKAEPLMKTVSMLELRRRADEIIAQVRRGQRLLLTYRGKAVATLEPVRDSQIAEDDPFYRLPELAEAKGRSLTNREMDDLIYGR